MSGITRTPRVSRSVQLLFAVGICCLFASKTWCDDRIAVRSKLVLNGKGASIEGGVVLIRSGKIEGVLDARAKIPQGYTVLDRGDAVVTPGFVDVRTTLGAWNDTHEISRALVPELRAKDAVDLGHEDLTTALRNGVTTVVVVPSESSPAGGRAAVIKSGGPDGHARLVTEDGPHVLSVSRRALAQDRFPTAPSGLLHLLRAALSAARDDAGSPLHSVVTGKERCFVFASSEQEIEMALDLGVTFELSSVIVGAGDSFDLAGRIATAGCGVVLDALWPMSSERSLVLGARLEEAGVPLAFSTGAPMFHSGSLRETAILACAGGMSPGFALAAITSRGAEFLGLDKRIGSIEVGKDADLVILSGDPLDARSRVVGVMIEGSLVHNAPHHAHGDSGHQGDTGGLGE